MLVVKLFEYSLLLCTPIIALLMFLVPTLAVAVTPASITILDVAPYNTFLLTCTATQPSSVTVTKTIEWRETRNGSTEVIAEDGISINITSVDLGNPTSSSSLHARVNSGSDREITCVAILEVPEDLPTLQFANAQVIVKGTSYTCAHVVYQFRVYLFGLSGPGEPVLPSSVSIFNITSGSISLEWVIPYIVYTPEDYRVLYGTSQQSLDQTSDSIASASDLTATNLSYSLIIVGLQPGMQYYFQIESRNSIGSVMSEVISGVALEAGMFKSASYILSL